MKPWLLFSRYRRALTLGVRTVVLDNQGGVFLVRHGYTPGWHFPGGAVEPRETVFEAAARELEEEAGLTLTEPPELFGLYLQRRHFGRDHVAVFVCRRWEKTRKLVFGFEIAEARFFSAADLPKGTTEGTRRRLAEILHGAPRATEW